MSLRQEFSSLLQSEKLFIIFSMLIGFFISADYGITRPVSQSIFLSVFTASAYPAFWLATVPLNLAVVFLYSRYLPRINPLRMMMVVCVVVMVINLLCVVLIPIYPKIIFFHFCWKDVYILLMFKQLWSMIHSTIASSRAKYLFGAIFGVGMCGGVLGSLIPGFLAPVFGSAPLLILTLPIYLGLIWSYRKAYFLSGASTLAASIDPSEQASASAGFIQIARNRYLLAILLLVVFMQMTVALVDYQFSHELEIAVPVQDLRTAYCGRIISVINLFSFLLQFFGSFLMLKWLGLKNSHYLIPLLLCTIVTGSCLIPGFAMAAVAYGFTKSIDYSLFGVVREMLFLPLKLDEKFRAKAVIDVFAYRTSKAIASFLLLGLQFYVGATVFSLTNYLLIGVLFAWIAVVTLLFKKYPLTAT
jgi:ATP:ADP antiporter, AAA family